MGTVCTSALLRGLVDLDVLDDEVGGVETLGISVGLGVLQESEQELGGLCRPASTGNTELLSCVVKPSAFLQFDERFKQVAVPPSMRSSLVYLQPPIFPRSKVFVESYLGKHDRYHQRIGAWEQPQSWSGRSRGT